MRIIIRRVLFIVSIIIGLMILNIVFIIKTYPVNLNLNGYKNKYVLRERADGFYDLQKDSLDVVFMGSSNIHCDINPNILWQNYGITAYDFSADQQSLGGTYCYMQEMFKYQSPKLVVVDVLSALGSKDSDDSANHFTFDPMKMSIIKLKGIYNVVPSDQWIEMVFPIVKYHYRYSEISSLDYKYFISDKENIFNGYFAYMVVNSFDKPVDDTENIGNVPDDVKNIFDKMTELCKENGAEILFIKTPLTYSDANSYYRGISEYLEGKADFICFNDYYDEIGLDFTSDFGDMMHMNYYGAEKFTNYLGGIIVDKYDIENKRLYGSKDDLVYNKYENDLQQSLEVLNKYIEEHGIDE